MIVIKSKTILDATGLKTDTTMTLLLHFQNLHPEMI